MLANYLLATQSLLQAPPADPPLYSTADLTRFINTARGQLAGEGQCIRFLATLPIIQGIPSYPFSSIDVSGNPGIAGVINVRTAWLVLSSGSQTINLAVIWTTATGAIMNWTTSTGAPMNWTIPWSVLVINGQQWMTPRPFEWFSLYELNDAAPVAGPPKRWSQFGQGAASSIIRGGSLYVAPPPDNAYTLALDAVCFPVDLVNDATPEALPFLWTDAIPYYAAYLAYLSAQSPARQADAMRMFQVYSEFVARARRFSTPGILPSNLPQNPSPTMVNQLGLAPQRGAA